MVKLNKKFLIGFGLILIFVIGYLFYSFQNFYTKTFIPRQLTAQAQGTNQDLSLDKPFNVLLLGYGGGNHDGAYLTDSMVVVHNDPQSKTIYLISIPRDIWVQIPTNSSKKSFWKINAAYEIGLDNIGYPNKDNQFKGIAGGGNMVKYVVNQVTGLTIDRFIAMDFSGFKKTIDSLGGVNINVETTFDDYNYPIDGQENASCGLTQQELNLDVSAAATLNMQPGKRTVWVRADGTVATTSADFACRFEHIHYDKGMNHMDGETALKYVRSRHSIQDGTDFGRSKRQRNLITAVRLKVFSINAIPSILPLINSLQDDIKTDFSLTEIQSLIPHLNETQKYNIQNIALTNQNVLMDSTTSDGQAILLPKDGSNTWDSIHSWLQIALSQNPTQMNALNISPVIKVENGTHLVGLATLAANRLQDKDFNVLTPSNADNQSYEKTVIYTDGSNIDQGVLNDLKNEFNVNKVETKSLGNDNCNILIIVGNDYNITQGKKVLNE